MPVSGRCQKNGNSDASGWRASWMPVPFTLAGRNKALVDGLPTKGLSPESASCPNGVACNPAACAGPCHQRTRVFIAVDAACLSLFKSCFCTTANCAQSQSYGRFLAEGAACAPNRLRRALLLGTHEAGDHACLGSLPAHQKAAGVKGAGEGFGATGIRRPFAKKQRACRHGCLAANAASKGCGWKGALSAQHLWLHVGKPAGGAGACRARTAKRKQRRCTKRLVNMD